MPEIAGENSVPLGVAGSGAAYVLSSREPNALALLQQGERARALHARNLKLAQQKADQDSAKQFNDFAKFQQDGSPYFGNTLNNRVYGKVMNQLAGAFTHNPNDPFARNVEVAPILQRTNNETVQSKAKTQYITDAMRAYQGDKALYNTQYIGENLSNSLRGKDGQGLLPSEFDEEAWNSGVKADHQAYNEPEVILRATKGLMPAISQKVAEAGTIGGQHTADQVKGRFVVLKNGQPVFNADGSPKLNLTADTQNLLESNPLFKLKVDAREQAYNQKREADPSLPRMSRRGHIAQMLGPLAYFDSSHDESLNGLPPHPRSSGSQKGIIADDGALVPGTYQAVQPGETTTTVVGNRAPYPGLNLLQSVSGQGTPMVGVPHLGQGRQPIRQTSSGERKEVHTEGARFTSYLTDDASGNLTEVKNNTVPQAGTFGNSYVLAIDPATGKAFTGKSEAEQQALIASGQARPQLFFEHFTDKNENYSKDYKTALAQLTDANNSANYNNRKSPAELEAQARKLVSQGVSRHLVPYNAQNAQMVDPLTGGHYRAAMRTMLAKYKRGNAPAPVAPKAKANPLNFSAPAASSGKAKPKANPLGF